MEQDIVPALLEAIESEFDIETYKSEILKKSLKSLQEDDATYLEVNDFAIEIGLILAKVLKNNLSTDILPEGIMYFNIANRILKNTLQKNHELITSFGAEVQKSLNEQAGIKIKAQIPEFNDDKVNGLVNRLCAEPFEDVNWLLADPVVTFSQGIVDDMVKSNVEFHAKSGLSPKIVRRSTGKCCKWCQNLVGVYEYMDEPKDVYRRHSNCRCTVDFVPDKNRKQNVWNKQWKDKEKNAKIESRKQLNLKDSYDTSRHEHNSDGTFKVSRVVQKKLPDDCKPLEVIDVVNKKGGISRTLINENGNRGMRIDNFDHGQPKWHPMGAHKHVISYDEQGNCLGDGKATILTPQDRKENGDIL